MDGPLNVCIGADTFLLNGIMMNEKQIKIKESIAYTLMGLFIFLSGYILFRMDYTRELDKMQAQSRMRLDSLAEMIQYIESIQESSRSSSDVHYQKNLSLLSSLPADHAAAAESAGQFRPADEVEEPYAYLRSEELRDIVKQSFNGILLLVSTADEKLPLIWQSSTFSDSDNVSEPGITPKMIREQQQIVKAADSNWFCTYAEIENSGLSLIYLTPLRSVILRSIFHVSLTGVSALIIFVTMITYFFSVLKYSNTHQLTKQEAVLYHPKNLRRKFITSGLTGALFVFASAAVFQTLDALHEESIIGSGGISRLLGFVGKTVSHRMTDEQERENLWYVNHGELIASLIAQDLDAVSREQLAGYCDLFDIDYIMLFDPEGKEIACSADYIGFTMDSGLGKDSRDFRRLLLGIPSIVHNVSRDPVTELERKYIGVRLPFDTGSGEPAYGALIMALLPDIMSIEDIDIIGQFHFIDKENRSYFYTDQETGRILYSSDKSLVGKTVMECGLPERSLLDGYTDFAMFNKVNSYVTMIKQETVDFFYVIRSAALFNSTLPLATASLVCYLVTLFILGWFGRKEYTAEAYEALLGSQIQQGDDNMSAAFDGYDFMSVSDFSELMVSKNRSDTRWEDKTPESRVATILKIDVLLLVVLPVLVLLRVYGSSSLFTFIMKGNWMRGVNLFSLCAIIIVVMIGILALVLSNGILSMIAGFTGRAGETACRLLYSLLNYLVILSILYYVFEYIGLSMSSYIASISAASLALSIGAQGMVADILAGVLILFEHQFHVGDIVEIEGYRGRVLEIGVRSTRLLCSGNDVRFINNSDIRSIVNKSIRNSTNRAEISLLTNRSLEEVEIILNRELPLIGQKSDLVLSGPVLNGIVKVSGPNKPGAEKSIVIRITYKCAEQDRDRVRDFVTREFYLLCEREEIGLR